MTDCPFCGRDPFHYVDNGCGMEAVAVNCCELGCLLFDIRDERETVEIASSDLSDIAYKLTEKRERIQALEDFLAEHDLHDKFMACSIELASQGRDEA